MEGSSWWNSVSQDVGKERVYDFWAGVNWELDEVRGRILGLKPLPSIYEVFTEVRREESRKRVMLPETIPGPENTLFVARNP